ncbi:nucleoporin NDC1 [Fopius arisanus]|uniref:Nucleoporin NDC1 n=1 Tax=Fopius arisanus TaxID=64838 RepID=A0A9R1T968_9HYME|nr:PREDICTED: nucleoporin NDC1 [Fopius arisanus]
MSELSQSGSRDLLFRRILMAVISSIIVQCLLMSLIVVLTHLSPTKPLSWPEEAFSTLISLRTWCYFFVLSTIIILQGVVCSKSYLTAPSLVDTRFASLCSVFTPHNLTVGGLHLTIGIVLVWLHLSFEDSNYSSLKKNCRTMTGSCITEEYVFLVTSGLFTAVHHFLKNNFLTRRYLQFPIIPQSKFSQVRRETSKLISIAMTSAVWPTTYFLVFYYTFGGYIRRLIASIMFLNVEEPLDKISRLFDTNLVFHVWLYSGLFSLTMDSMHLLFQVHLTEWMEFEIGQSVYSDNRGSMSLPEALGMDEVPIIQHLGYLDLMTLSQKQRSRRGIVFSLSQPGGHPYNWNCIVEKCLGMIKGYSKKVEEVCAVRQEITAPLSAPASLDRPYSFHMRNLARVESLEKTPGTAIKPVPSTGEFLVEFFRSRRQRIVDYVMSKPLVLYFFGVRSDSRIQHLLVTGQPVVWAVDAISSLAVISLKEDPYGIVQKDLPGMIEELLGLKLALDKLHKMILLSRKSQQDDKNIRHLLGALRSAGKRSIYRIFVAFNEYFEDLALEQNVKDQLQGFFSFRE